MYISIYIYIYIHIHMWARALARIDALERRVHDLERCGGIVEDLERLIAGVHHLENEIRRQGYIADYNDCVQLT